MLLSAQAPNHLETISGTTDWQASEADRLAALARYRLMDTPPTEAFDRVTRLARQVFGVPIALISLVDDKRQWFKSRQGIDVAETPRDQAFCAHALNHDTVFCVPDAAQDGRFANNPLVNNGPEIRFYAGAPLVTHDGFTLGTLCIIDTKPRQFTSDQAHTLTDLAAVVMNEIELNSVSQQKDEFEELCNRDPLTGAYNRRAFDKLLAAEFGRSKRYTRDLAVVIADIDYFKQINDEHGHQAGDAVLQSFAHICESGLREEDAFARIGGEEFAFLLPESDKPGALRCMQRLRQRVHNLPAMHHGRPIAYTVSFGIACREPKDHPTDLTRRADQALYRAKNAGRDRITSG